MSAIEQKQIAELTYQRNTLLDALQMLLPLASAYLRHAPSDPDNAKLETARQAIREIESDQRSKP